MATLSTHVLDTSVGRPAAGVAVTLSELGGAELAAAVTDDDGRIGALGPAELTPGDYALRFDVAPYFAGSGRTCFYPEVVVAFSVTSGESDGHYHVPLLLNPYGYGTYRGS